MMKSNRFLYMRPCAAFRRQAAGAIRHPGQAHQGLCNYQANFQAGLGSEHRSSSCCPARLREHLEDDRQLVAIAQRSVCIYIYIFILINLGNSSIKRSCCIFLPALAGCSSFFQWLWTQNACAFFHRRSSGFELIQSNILPQVTITVAGKQPGAAELCSAGRQEFVLSRKQLKSRSQGVICAAQNHVQPLHKKRVGLLQCYYLLLLCASFVINNIPSHLMHY